MNRRHWKSFVIAGAAIVLIVVAAMFMLSGEESLRGKIVKLDGTTVTLEGEGGLMKTVRLDSAEGLKVGSEVEIDGYNPVTESADAVRVVRQ
jgi:uncharacterized membrane protein YphA (DoxX/SURF4 family)